MIIMSIGIYRFENNFFRKLLTNTRKKINTLCKNHNLFDSCYTGRNLFDERGL